MAKPISTDHYLPDIHDEGKIKRYGLSIVIAVLVMILLAFVIWATYTGRQNQQRTNDPAQPAQSSGEPQH